MSVLFLIFCKMKKTREEKIAKIYDVIADKTLSFWCKVFHSWVVCFVLSDYSDNERFLVWDTVAKDTGAGSTMYTNRIWKEKIQNIIWHPVMIWDVLERMIYDEDLCSERYWLIWRYNDNDEPIRKKLKEPIENQTDACINFIYKIVKCSTT